MQKIDRLFSTGILVFVRLLFPYLWLSLSNALKRLPESGKFIFCTLDDEFLYRDDDGNGRYAFLPLNVLSQMGYSIYFYHPVNLIGFKRLGYCGRYIFGLKNVKFIGKIPEDTSNMIYMFDEPREELLSRSWKKLVYINILRPAHFSFGEIIEMPFSMHPMQYHTGQLLKLPELRQTERKLRIFFGGNTAKQAYQGKSVPQYGQLNRHEATELLIASVKETEIMTDLQTFNAVVNKDRSLLNKFILLRADESGQLKTEDWLATIAKSQFFMCFSGTNRPMCHNAVEAMSVGTIPIISYQDWFYPALEHMKNAIVYSGKEDLVSKVKQVLAMSEEQVRHMSKNVMDYYDEFLTPADFQKRFENNKDRICTLMLFPRIILSEKEEARLSYIKEGISRHLRNAHIAHD